MLKDDFYIITDFKNENNSIVAIIELNKNHSIFNGHFPFAPIVPGVCEVQIIKEILSIYFQKNIELNNASDIKFLRAINPVEDNIVLVKIGFSFADNEAINANAQIFQKEACCLKLNAVFGFRK
jgi:3-hydroxyacyl-[acyl-carrier-protein] dehydratase